MDIPLNSIIHGDCISVMQKMPDNSVDLVIADPPYNLSKGTAWKWDNSAHLPGMGGNWNKVMEDWDNLDIVEYFKFTSLWLAEVKRITKPTGSIWTFGSYHNIGLVNFICQILDIEIINEVVWYKRNAFPNLSGRRLTASHETILWSHPHKGGDRKYYFNYEESKFGDYSYDRLKTPEKQMRTVWDIPNNKERREIEFGKHPTQKPLRLLKRMIQLTSKQGDLILTPFAGSGSECLAAMELGRNYIGIEIESKFVDLAKLRLKTPQTELDLSRLAVFDA
ncbi:DNA-methyltransferase [Corynebacterium sp. H130]|uniref:DNA-methyltransferase n=1 Tax=Corynebacterium sp. H130 TaxID=3133444 RepID=UPI0030B06978